MAGFHAGLAFGLGAALASGICALLVHPEDSPPPPSLADAAARIEKRLDALEKRTPNAGFLMTNVQVHFAKLWYAVQWENWALAAFELQEVSARLEQAALARPEENGVNLVALTDAMKSGPIAKFGSEVIGKKDKASFEAVYTEVLQLCNGCHQQTGRDFIRVTIPSAPPVYTQDWKPLPK